LIELVLLVDVLALNDLLQEEVVHGAGIFVDLSAYTPHESEDKGVHHYFLGVGRHFVGLAFFGRLPVLDESIEDLNHVVNDEVGASRHWELASAVDIFDTHVSNVVHERLCFLDDLLLNVA
jgi:hypothetical protein